MHKVCGIRITGTCRAGIVCILLNLRNIHSIAQIRLNIITDQIFKVIREITFGQTKQEEFEIRGPVFGCGPEPTADVVSYKGNTDIISKR